MSLSTHVLDTTHGRPAAGMHVALEIGAGVVMEGDTDQDGRLPALRDQAIPTGQYRLRFCVGAYFRGLGLTLPDPPFLDEVTIEFGIADESHYHVPLLVSPFGYSTYRGS